MRQQERQRENDGDDAAWRCHKRRGQMRRMVVAGVLTLAALFSCGTDESPRGTEEHREEQHRPTPSADSLRTHLFLQKNLSWGISPDSVRTVVPGLGETGPEGGYRPLGAEGLREASALLEVAGRECLLECNFEDNALYSFYYRCAFSDSTAASAFEERIRRAWVTAYGTGSVEMVREPGYSARTTMWETAHSTLAVTRTLPPSGHRVSWGAQRRE